MDVDMVSFTGSTVTGKRFLGHAGESNAKEVVLEMGGKNACVVMGDAENLDCVAAHIANGALWNMGENCSAISRLTVHRDVKAALMNGIEAHLREWPMGDPLDPEMRLGAMVSKAHFEKVTRCLAGAPKARVGGVSCAGGRMQPMLS